MSESEPIFLTATQWLEKKTNNRNLIEQVRLNINLNLEIQKVLGEHLSPYCQIIKIENSTLFLATANQACAAKVRQLGPSIQRQLKLHQQFINEIRIKIVASLGDQGNSDATKARPTSHRQLVDNPNQNQPSEAALTAFRQLSHDLKSGPLADHVNYLLKKWEE